MKASVSLFRRRLFRDEALIPVLCRRTPKLWAAVKRLLTLGHESRRTAWVVGPPNAARIGLVQSLSARTPV